mmetsp:Transcript_20708/g.57270  ORF Transcript_20708/g.57270 Transcript_20708/m.57270 type:complete len:151 (-) Transcript_20708:167-619(-)
MLKLLAVSMLAAIAVGTTCESMTESDPCFQKFGRGSEPTAANCTGLGSIGCNNTSCELMGTGSDAHCMSPMETDGHDGDGHDGHDHDGDDGDGHDHDGKGDHDGHDHGKDDHDGHDHGDGDGTKAVAHAAPAVRCGMLGLAAIGLPLAVC